MDAARPLVGLLGVGVVVFCVGALVSLVGNTLLGSFGTAAGVVVLLVTGSLLAAIAVGARGREWLRNPGYW
ncbi:hypothetical protein BRC72_03295 [Halobacteriales archaeon QH_7_66_36]|nr:MAG: hypothetical protein BRC72_03295 [Halobacteriales archaeon QH_7_66_36]